MLLYTEAVEQEGSSYQTDRTGSLEGWWENGAYTEQRELEPPYREVSADLRYRIQHSNLFLEVRLYADFDVEQEHRYAAFAHETRRGTAPPGRRPRPFHPGPLAASVRSIVTCAVGPWLGLARVGWLGHTGADQAAR